MGAASRYMGPKSTMNVWHRLMISSAALQAALLSTPAHVSRHAGTHRVNPPSSFPVQTVPAAVQYFRWLSPTGAHGLVRSEVQGVASMSSGRRRWVSLIFLRSCTSQHHNTGPACQFTRLRYRR